MLLGGLLMLYALPAFVMLILILAGAAWALWKPLPNIRAAATVL
jgi:hypothetical protein